MTAGVGLCRGPNNVSRCWGPVPWDMDCASAARNMSLLHVLLCQIWSLYVKLYRCRQGSQIFLGTLWPRSLWIGVWLTPKTHLPHYQAEFGCSQLNHMGIGTWSPKFSELWAPSTPLGQGAWVTPKNTHIPTCYRAKIGHSGSNGKMVL